MTDQEINDLIDSKILNAAMTIATFNAGIYVKQDGSTPITGIQEILQVKTVRVFSDTYLKVIAPDNLTISSEGLIDITSADRVNLPSKVVTGDAGTGNALLLDAGAVTGNKTQKFKNEDGDIVTD